MSKNKEIIIPIFNNEYKVIVCWGDSRYIKKIWKSWHHDNVADVEKELIDRRGVCFNCKGCSPIIALPHAPRKPEEIGTLAHEAVHAIDNIFRMVEEEAAEEIYAHCVGAVVRGTLEKL